MSKRLALSTEYHIEFPVAQSPFSAKGILAGDTFAVCTVQMLPDGTSRHETSKCLVVATKIDSDNPNVLRVACRAEPHILTSYCPRPSAN